MELYPQMDNGLRPVLQIAMARPPRVYAPGGTVHVVARCNNRESYFNTTDGFEVFQDHPFYCLTLALLGYGWQRKGKPPRILGISFSFCLVNLAALVGVAKFLVGKKAGRWEPVR